MLPSLKEDLILDLHDLIERVQKQEEINGYFLVVNVNNNLNMRKYDAMNVSQLLGMTELLLMELKMELVSRHTDMDDIIIDDEN